MMPGPSVFIEACYGRPTAYTPIWLMRQAGRYQASYRALREKIPFLTLCKTPELATQVTLAAVSELGVDAAIIFSDILLPLEAMGAPIEITDEGPSLRAVVRTEAAVDSLLVPEPKESLPYLLEAISLTRAALPEGTPLIGFAGAPITLASYLVEGGQSKSYPHLRELFFGSPRVAHRLLEKLANTAVAVLQAQIEAGCQAVMLFDSWAGILCARDYRALGLPYLRLIFDALGAHRVPRILFAGGSSPLLEVMEQSGCEVIGVDWRVELGEARRRLGRKVALQGNLDPGYLFLEETALEERIRDLLAEDGLAPGHIFNLGHGVLPNTPEDRVRFLVEAVHRLSSNQGK
jgi:uroporphyrinogen decarboxylase